MGDAARRRREFIRVHHPDRGGDPDLFMAGLRRFDEQAGAVSPEPLPRVIVVAHRGWLTRTLAVLAARLHPGERGPRVR